MNSDLELQAVLDQFEESIRRELRELYEQRSARLEGLLAKLRARLGSPKADEQELSILLSAPTERTPLEELSEDNLVQLFKSTEIRQAKALSLMRQAARELVSREGMTATRASELLGVSRQTIYTWLKDISEQPLAQSTS